MKTGRTGHVKEGTPGHITAGLPQGALPSLRGTYQAIRAVPPTLLWLFAVPALVGLAAVLSLAGAVVAVQVSSASFPRGDWTWYWFASAWMGAIAFPLFGTLGLAAAISDRSNGAAGGGPSPRTARSVAFGLLGTLCLVLSVVISDQAYAPVPSIMLVAAGGAAYYALWQSRAPQP